MDRIDLEKIGWDRFNILTLSRKINALIDKIEELESIIDEIDTKYQTKKDENEESIGSTTKEIKISDVEFADLTLVQQEVKNDADSTTNLWEEMVNAIDSKPKRYKMIKSGGRTIRREIR